MKHAIARNPLMTDLEKTMNWMTVFQLSGSHAETNDDFEDDFDFEGDFENALFSKFDGAAPDIMDSIVADSVAMPFRRTLPKLGRNEPCPCGSGKKYKKCCGVD